VLARGLVLALASCIIGCSSSSSIKKSNNTQLNRALTTAEGLLGTPYCYSGSSPECFDCSGLMVYCFAAANIDLPRISVDMAAVGRSVQIPNLESGDLVFFATKGKTINHVGLYVGNGAFIHSSTSKGVMISSISDPYWQPRFICARRIEP
jgi:cell wall-associated NlpC family hydrolase